MLAATGSDQLGGALRAILRRLARGIRYTYVEARFTRNPGGFK